MTGSFGFSLSRGECSRGRSPTSDLSKGAGASKGSGIVDSGNRKNDFKDTKSMKSVKSERSDKSEPGSSKLNKSNQNMQKPGKVSRGENQKNNFLPGTCFLGRRLNEARPVYRPAQSKPRSRFSLRNLLYSNPLQSPPFSSSPARSRKQKEMDTQSEGSWVERGSQGTVSSTQHSQAHTSVVQDTTSNVNEIGLRECFLCLAECTPDQFPPLRNCSHLSCIVCLQQYVRIEIQEGRANLKCPQCNQLMHPNDIEDLVGEDTALLNLYQFLMVRRVLAADPDTRWCPAPNCSYAVVATGCASCPKLDCEREGCDFSFCYHCKAEWHPNITCDKARAQRHPVRSGSQDSGMGGGLEIKVCPRCSVLIVKMDDGSCNHMTCAVCGSEFCWLCMKEISDLHYLSPSGCTFWGKKPWSRKKKLLWQLGTIVGAPVGIALIAGISVPAMVIGIPVWVGRKISSKHVFSSKPRKVASIVAGVVSSIIISPVLAGLAVSIGVPILLAYVYGVVPLSLCRSGGCGVRTTTQGVRIDVDEEVPYRKVQQAEVGSRVANPSIGELSLGASLSMGSGSHLDRLVECDRESASNTAIAGYSLTGSVASSSLGQHRLEVGADVHPRKKFSFSSERLSETVSLSEKSATVSLMDDGAASTRALAGSILQYKMENSSVNSYRTGVATPGSSGSAAQETDGVSFRHDTDSATYRHDADSATYPSGDEISLRSMPGQRSLSPITGMTGEELTAALRRSNRRRILEKQPSETSGEDQSSRAASVDQDLCERVRFDTHISFLDSSKPDMDPDRSRLTLKKADMETETLREETAEELALVVSPITHRGPSPFTGPSPTHSFKGRSPNSSFPNSPSGSGSPPRLGSPENCVLGESLTKVLDYSAMSSVATPSPIHLPGSPTSPSEMSPMLPALNSTTRYLSPSGNVSLVRVEGPVTSVPVGQAASPTSQENTGTDEDSKYFTCIAENTTIEMTTDDTPSTLSISIPANELGPDNLNQ